MFWDTDGKLIRIAVFFDGGYFDAVWHYHNHKKRGGLRFKGVQEFIRHMVGEYEKVDKSLCHIVESHYFRGRFSSEDMDERQLRNFAEIQDALVHAGIVEHYMEPKRTKDGPKERGIDVWLSLEAFDLAVHKRFDVLALVGGDGDYVPLVRKLNGIGTRTMVLAWDFEYEWTNAKQERIPKWTATNELLKEACTSQVDMVTMIENTPKKGRDDPIEKVIDRLFGKE
jgi:hypothetical protein